MPTPRKRNTSGFSQPEKSEIDEAKEVEKFLDAAAAEMFETISREEEEAAVEEEVKVAAKPFVPQEIVPTEDPGPISTPDEQITSTPVPKVEPVVLKAPPKRHPRNVPKFSRHK